MQKNATSLQVRPLSRGMRGVFAVGAVLVFLAGFQLFILTDHTARFFAWTIKVPLTAAFLGAFYWTALALAVLSARQTVWARARVGVAGVFVFITLTLVMTLLHLDQFHFDSTRSVARGAAWLWLVIYAADPPAVLILWLRQLRVPGGDPPRMERLPAWFRIVISLQALTVLGVGVALFAAPSSTAGLWPWKLTPLTARAISAWLIGLGLVIADAVWEDDWVRIRPALASYSALGILQLIAVARYAGTVDWSAGKGWIYVAFLATVLLMGLYGWGASGRADRAGWSIRPADVVAPPAVPGERDRS